MIAGKVNTSESEQWYDQIGSTEQGINHLPAPAMCTTHPLPEAMNPIRQHWLATLAVGSFLHSQFATDTTERQRYHNYLVQQLAYENPEIKVEIAATGG